MRLTMLRKPQTNARPRLPRSDVRCGALVGNCPLVALAHNDQVSCRRLRQPGDFPRLLRQLTQSAGETHNHLPYVFVANTVHQIIMLRRRQAASFDLTCMWHGAHSGLDIRDRVRSARLFVDRPKALKYVQLRLSLQQTSCVHVDRFPIPDQNSRTLPKDPSDSYPRTAYGAS